MESENPLQGVQQPVRSEDLSGDHQGSSEKSQPTDETKDDAEGGNNFLAISGDFIYRHQIEPRLQFCVPREETFPIPLKFVDVTRTTQTDLDVMQEKRVVRFLEIIYPIVRCWTRRLLLL